MSHTLLHTSAAMGTVVTIEVGVPAADPGERARREHLVREAMDWFHAIEATCSRFDPASELRQMCGQIGTPVPCSPLLFEAVSFAWQLARETDGAFDPTVGRTMEAIGFDIEFRSGRARRTPVAGGATWRDLTLDAGARAITLHRPLLLDLGAVAKGLAIDLAAKELESVEDFVVDAGGDLYASGRRPDGRPWSVGIRHPREQTRLIDTVRVSNGAVCTSGDYERRSPAGAGHHIVDPRSSAAVTAVASVTTIAPTAMVADALATAAFVLGPRDGLRLLERHGVDGLVVSASMECATTRGFHGDHLLERHGRPRPGRDQALLSHA